jgi:hypothetical protein
MDAPLVGDRVRFTPCRRTNTTLEGVVVDKVQSQGGGIGYNLLCPLPGDPGRVLRVWCSDGEIEIIFPAS